MMQSIIYPDASDLDTTGWDEASSYEVGLYLIPADESDSGRPEVRMHAGIGIGWPMPAHLRRWTSIGKYGTGVIGDSVLDVLHDLEPLLLAASAAYRGTRWDGSNHVGTWESDPDTGLCEERFDLDLAWQERADELRRAWDAYTWYGADDTCWTELCEEAGIDPERALAPGADIDALAAEVAAIIEPRQDEVVTGTAGYARDQAERYREMEAE